MYENPKSKRDLLKCCLTKFKTVRYFNNFYKLNPKDLSAFQGTVAPSQGQVKWPVGLAFVPSLNRVGLPWLKNGPSSHMVEDKLAETLSFCVNIS